MSDNFKDKQQAAIEQMRELNRRSMQNGALPDDVQGAPSQKTTKQNSFLSGLGLPFLDNLKTDGDLTLILGILLLLLSEKADKRLLFALIYILL